MRKIALSPEIHVDPEVFKDNPDIEKVMQMDEGYVHVYMDHPVLGDTLEVFRLSADGKHLTLKGVFPQDLQEEDDIEIAVDYYNNFVLEGAQTYLQYFSESTGWYLLSKND